MAPSAFVLGGSPSTSNAKRCCPAGAPAGLHRFAFVLDGLPPGASADGAALTFTLVAGGSAVEVSTHLD